MGPYHDISLDKLIFWSNAKYISMACINQPFISVSISFLFSKIAG